MTSQFDFVPGLQISDKIFEFIAYAWKPFLILSHKKEPRLSAHGLWALLRFWGVTTG